MRPAEKSGQKRRAKKTGKIQTKGSPQRQFPLLLNEFRVLKKPEKTSFTAENKGDTGLMHNYTEVPIDLFTEQTEKNMRQKQKKHHKIRRKLL